MSTKYAAKFGKGLQNTIDAIRQRETFDAGNLWAADRGRTYGGILPEPWASDYHETLSQIDYVIYSYATPIAWHVRGEGWAYPDVRYSSTTTGHQSTVRSALRLDYAGRCSGLVPVRTHTKAAARRAVEVFA